MGRRPRPRRASSRWSSGRAGSAGGAPPGAGAGAGAEAYAAEGYDDVPRDEDYDPYAHGYAHGAGTREDPTTFDVDDGSFPGDDWDAVGDADVAGSNPTGEETRTTADDAAWFSRWNARSAAGGNGGGASRWGQPARPVEPAEGRLGGGNPRAGRRDADFDVDAYDPDARDTPYDDLLEDDPGVEVAPPPSASDWITGVGAGGATTSKTSGAWAGGESGGGRGGGYAAEAAARRHRWSATASYATGDFRKRGVGFGNGFGYDADDLGDPSELDRDTIGYVVDDDPRVSRDGGVVFGDENDGAKPSNPLARVRERERTREHVASEGDERIRSQNEVEVEVEVEVGSSGAGLGSSTQPDEHAADDDDAPPRKRPSVLDEPRIPHTRVPRKKFAQATLAFG